MDDLIRRLNNIPNAYFEFVDSIVAYAKSKPSRFEAVSSFLEQNETVTVSDMIRFVIEQPDFFEDDVTINAKVG